MWTEEKLKEAAEKYWRECTEILYHEHKRTTLTEAFLAGCKYIINNTQKDNEDKVRKEDMEAEGRQILPILVLPSVGLHRQAQP